MFLVCLLLVVAQMPLGGAGPRLKQLVLTAENKELRQENTNLSSEVTALLAELHVEKRKEKAAVTNVKMKVKRHIKKKIVVHHRRRQFNITLACRDEIRPHFIRRGCPIAESVRCLHCVKSLMGEWIMSGYFTKKGTACLPPMLPAFCRPPKDCVLSSWKAVEKCTATHTCGQKAVEYHRQILTSPEPGGKVCAVLIKNVTCVLPKCPVDCAVGVWGNWSHCDLACTRHRYRSVLTHPHHGGVACPPTNQSFVCPISRCYSPFTPPTASPSLAPTVALLPTLSMCHTFLFQISKLDEHLCTKVLIGGKWCTASMKRAWCFTFSKLKSKWHAKIRSKAAEALLSAGKLPHLRFSNHKNSSAKNVSIRHHVIDKKSSRVRSRNKSTLIHSTCPFGMFRRNSSCVLCHAGKFSNGTAPSCTPCPRGRFGATQGLMVSTCSGDCKAGRFSPRGATHCKLCPGGYFQKAAGPNVDCSRCQAGRYSRQGALYCEDCGVNQFQTSPGQSSCIFCPAGRIARSNYAGTKACRLACPAGSYYRLMPSWHPGVDRAQKYMCLKCSRGRFGFGNDTTSLCNGGCARGRYCNSDCNSHSCTSTCPEGKFNAGVAESTCTDCPAGYYNPRKGQGSCSRCNWAYTAQKTAVVCKAICPSSTYVSFVPGSSLRLNKTALPALAARLGKVIFQGTRDRPPLIICEPCKPGRYSVADNTADVIRSRDPTAAQHHRHRRLPVMAVSASCSGPCAPGRFGRIGGASPACTGRCPAGKFSLGGAAACAPCAAGRYGPPGSEGPTAHCPSACPAGSYSTAGDPACTLCPAGYFGIQPGSGLCFRCASGMTTAFGGSRRCALKVGSVPEQTSRRSERGRVSRDPTTGARWGAGEGYNRVAAEAEARQIREEMREAAGGGGGAG